MAPSPTTSIAQYVETDCTIEHDGQTFEAGGAVVTPDLILGYVNEPKRQVTDWHGTTVLLLVTDIRKHSQWVGRNYVTLSHVWAVDVNGQRWYGKYGSDWSDLIRMRPVNS